MHCATVAKVSFNFLCPDHTLNCLHAYRNRVISCLLKLSQNEEKYRVLS